ANATRITDSTGSVKMPPATNCGATTDARNPKVVTATGLGARGTGAPGTTATGLGAVATGAPPATGALAEKRGQRGPPPPPAPLPRPDGERWQPGRRAGQRAAKR